MLAPSPSPNEIVMDFRLRYSSFRSIITIREKTDNGLGGNGNGMTSG